MKMTKIDINQELVVKRKLEYTWKDLDGCWGIVKNETVNK